MIRYVGLESNGTFAQEMAKCPFCWATFFRVAEVEEHVKKAHGYPGVTWTLFEVSDPRYPGQRFWFLNERPVSLGTQLF